MKHLDIPPVWLAGALALAWVQSRYFGLGLSLGDTWSDLLGGLLVGGGVILMALAVYEMRRHRTTLHPHGLTERLVTTGIFSRSRNPIYLGDSMVLAGLLLAWDAILAFPLLPLFVLLLERRFVLPEEKRLSLRFGAEFANYVQKTRRWL